jgi:hypothetical protein
VTKKFSFIALIAALVAVAGVSVASAVASPSNSQVIYACAWNNGSGNLGTPSTSSKSCPAGSTQISWNVAGPQGATGAAGPKGDKGDKGDPGFSYENAVASGNDESSQLWSITSASQTICVGPDASKGGGSYECVKPLHNVEVVSIHSFVTDHTNNTGYTSRPFWIVKSPCSMARANASGSPSGYLISGQQPYSVLVNSSEACLVIDMYQNFNSGSFQVVGSNTPLTN